MLRPTSRQGKLRNQASQSGKQEATGSECYIYCQSDEHCNYFKDNVGEASERWVGVHTWAFPSTEIRYHLELN